MGVRGWRRGPRLTHALEYYAFDLDLALRIGPDPEWACLLLASAANCLLCRRYPVPLIIDVWRYI